MNSASDLGRMLGNLSNRVSNLESNVYPDDPSAQLQIIITETVVSSETGVVSSLSYASDSFIIDHPVYGVIDSSVLLIDGGYQFTSTLYDDASTDQVLSKFTTTSLPFEFDTNHYEGGLTMGAANKYVLLRNTPQGIGVVGVACTYRKVKLGTNDAGAETGICLGSGGASTWYFLQDGYRIDTANGSVKLYKIVSGVDTLLSDTGTTLSDNTDHTISLYVHRGVVYVSIDSSTFSVTDSTYTPDSNTVYMLTGYNFSVTFGTRVEVKNIYDVSYATTLYTW